MVVNSDRVGNRYSLKRLLIVDRPGPVVFEIQQNPYIAKLLLQAILRDISRFSVVAGHKSELGAQLLLYLDMGCAKSPETLVINHAGQGHPQLRASLLLGIEE